MKTVTKFKTYIKDLLSKSVKTLNIDVQDNDLIINISNPNKVTFLDDNVGKRETFYFSNASFSTTEIKKDDFGVIERLDKKAHKVIFQNLKDKENLAKFNDKYEKDGKDLIYIVDIKIIKVEDIVKIYKITNIYYDETMDLEYL
jgi:hypothetical protein